jgi:uncharacterized protein YcsI (UPF0317 family)
MTIPATGKELREQARNGLWSKPTAGVAPGYAQANLVVLPRDFAFEFFLFCQRNPKPCPILDVTDAGDPEPLRVAPGADLRRDLPLYRVYRSDQTFSEVTDILSLWGSESVGFLLGCSFTFDHALMAAGIVPRHIEEARNVPMYRTNIATTPAGRFRGPLVVSMRPMTPAQAEVATRLSAAFPQSHGGPVHVGNPAAIGIASLDCSDYGESVSVRSGEVPVFWACGVTPQAALAAAGINMVITHAPGHMFVTDILDTGN